MAFKQSQTLIDTDRRLVLKLVNSGTVETANLAVNGAALGFATSLLTVTANAAAGVFWPNEVINAAAGGSATVQAVINATSIRVINVTGTFTTAQNVVGASSGVTLVQNGAVAPETNGLNVSKIAYDIGGPDASVELHWAGTGGGANNRCIATLSRGQGILEFDSIAGRIPNNANSATGNIVVTTNNFVANSSYTITLDVSKTSGYAAPSQDWRK